MAAWSKEDKLIMQGILRDHGVDKEKLREQCQSGGLAYIEGLSTEEKFLLYCAIPSFRGIARIAGVHHSTIQSRFHDDGWDDNALTARVHGYSPGPEEGIGPIHADDTKIEYYQNKVKRLAAENTRLKHFYNIMRETIRDEVVAFKPIAPRYPKPRRAKAIDEELAILGISDVHIGEAVSPRITGGLSEYNVDVFLRRIENYKRAFDSVINQHIRHSYPVNTGLVFLLGDMATGEDVYPMQLARVDIGAMRQIIWGGLQMAELLRWLAGQFKHLRVYAIYGNHGKTKTTTINMDYLLYTIMAASLSQQENLRFFISDSHYMGVHIGPDCGYLDFHGHDRIWNFLLTHGHQARSYNGVPYYSLDRLVGRYTTMTGVLWDRLFCGHHHRDVGGPAGSWCINGSWVGGTDYSQEKMQGNDRPTQRVWGFHPKQGETWSYALYLDEEPRLRPHSGDDGIYTPYTEAQVEEGALTFNERG